MEFANDLLLVASWRHTNHLSVSLNQSKVVDFANLVLIAIHVNAGEADLGCASLLLELKEFYVGNGVNVVVHGLLA